MSIDEKTLFGGHVSKLIFNDNTVLNISCNDIVVFVGPNNAGKSQALRDINELCNKKISPIVISDLIITKTLSPIDALLDNISYIHNNGDHKTYQGFNYNCNSYNIAQYSQTPYHGDLRNLFVSYLNTESRLSICYPPQIINKNQPKEHPIHYVAYNTLYRQKISKYFKKAFGKDLIPNTQFGSQLPLCIGVPIKFPNNDFEDEQLRLEAYSESLEKYPQIQNQGDGIKSFTGILLNLIIEYYRTFLIDEPESFLHPPQARIMGHTLGELLSNKQQAFISTHSPEILMGLLEVCPERIKIVRITRDDNSNHFSILNNDEFNVLWKDPLLRHSEIMTSIFHKNVVLCESDSDCRLYSIIHSFLKEEEESYSETLFVHCGGKQRMGKIVTALKSLNIPVWIIPDIDVLNNSSIFKNLIECADGNWNDFSSDLSILSANLTTNRSFIKRTSFKQQLLDIIDSSENINLANTEIKDIKELLKTETKWSQLKEGGINSLPAGDGCKSFQSIDTNAKKLKIFIVPVGELECFIKEVGGHGPEWVNKVLEQYPDLKNPIYNKIKDFISLWDL
ncbi:MAG: ATP-dependent nuclease [Lachnospiraceae bacterium]